MSLLMTTRTTLARLAGVWFAIMLGASSAALAQSVDPGVGSGAEAPGNAPNAAPDSAPDSSILPRIPSPEEREALRRHDRENRAAENETPESKTAETETGRPDAAADAGEAEDEKNPAAALDRAFADLKSDDEEVRAKAEARISRIWQRSGSASMDLLLQRAKTAIEREDYDTALLHLTDLVTLRPEFAEGWHLRAQVHFQREDFGAAIADIGEALAREERHFAALTGLGLLLETIGRESDALAMFRRALELHPNMEAAKEAVERLSPVVDGRGA